jgi:hypothetical protein
VHDVVRGFSSGRLLPSSANRSNTTLHFHRKLLMIKILFRHSLSQNLPRFRLHGAPMACSKNPQALLHRQRQIADRECCAPEFKFRFACIAVNDDLGNMT